MNGLSLLERLLEELGLGTDRIHDPDDERVRRAVEIRAKHACEYCLMPTAGRYEIEHIIAKKRYQRFLSGTLPGHDIAETRCTTANHLMNFAWSCPFCNASKGVRTWARVQGKVYRLFNPRTEKWKEHFYFADQYLFIEPIDAIGEATVRALNLNSSSPRSRLGARHTSILAGTYPPTRAQGWTS